MSNFEIYTSKFVAISTIMYFFNKNFIMHKMCFSLQEKQFHAITPPKLMQTLLFYWLVMPQPY
jgi:hypothetical protein